MDFHQNARLTFACRVLLVQRIHSGRPLAVMEEAIETAGLRSLDVTLRHAAAVEHVRASHADPFDRLLLAQCEVETMRLLTADRALRRLPVAVG